MEKIVYSIHSNKDGKTTYIRASAKTEDELGFIAVKSGFIEVAPAKAESLLKKFNDNELSVRFGDKNLQGNYELTPVVVVTENELESKEEEA